MLAPTSSHVWL